MTFRHRLVVPDGLLNPESKTPEYLTGVAAADNFPNAFLVGRALAQRYGQAFLLDVTSTAGSHLFVGWRKATDVEDPDGIRHVITGYCSDHHEPENAGVGGDTVRLVECPACAKIRESVQLPS